VLLDIHRAQDGGLDLTDIAERAGDVVITRIAAVHVVVWTLSVCLNFATFFPFFSTLRQ